MKSRAILTFAAFTVSVLLLVSTTTAGPARRIVSLAPNITEILFALGLGDRIAGVTSFCDHPAEALKKPKVGGIVNPSLEKIVRLKPDIVVLTTDGNPREINEKLKSLGIKTYVFRARKITELPEAIIKLGSALGVKERALALSEQFKNALSKYKKLSHRKKRPKALFIIWPEPLIVAGPGTAISEAMELIGLDNIASDAESTYPRYSLEEVIRRDPEIIFIGRGHVNMKKVSERILKRLQMVSAVREGRVFFVSDALYRLGPRVIKGIEELSEHVK